MLLPLLLLHAFCGSQVWGLGTGIASHMLCRHVGRLQACFVDEKGGQAQSTKLEADPMPTCLWGPGCCCHLARCTPREQASVLAWPVCPCSRLLSPLWVGSGSCDLLVKS